MAPVTTTDLEQLLRATAQNIVRDRQGVFLSNALSQSAPLLPTTAVLQLLNHVLKEHDSLSWMVGQLLAVAVGQGNGGSGAGLAAVRARLGIGNSVSAVAAAAAAAANNGNTTGLLLVPEDDGDDMEDDDGDDMEEDEEMQDRAVAAAAVTSSTSAALKKARTGARLTKRDLQTVPKLDRVYQEHVVAWQKTVLSRMAASNSQEKESLLGLAARIGIPEQWLHWGRTLFPITANGGGTSEKLYHDSSNAVDADLQLCLAQEAYVTLTANMLQGSTGLRPRQSGTNAFLTKLAFAPDFLGSIWQYCRKRLDRGAEMALAYETVPSARSRAAVAAAMRQETITYTCLSVFCDLFAHHLIALKDDQFLKNHTTVTDSSSSQVIILAEEVIVRLRDLLYELYWGKPVRADHIRLPFAGSELSEEDRLEVVRGRLLLTGTKLWNSLYQIWCRLLRHTPFCDESTWLFPHMTTLTGDGAVVSHRQTAREADDDSVVSMDVDSDDDDDDADNNGASGGASMQPVSAAEAEDDAMADTFSDPKMARILTCIPQALPFGKRVKLFDSLLKADKAKTQDESAEMREVMLNMMRGEEGATSFRERVEIRRDKLYDDAMRQLNSLGPKLKKKIQVTFVSQHGTQEAGIDGGGVFKEFIDDLIKDAFQPDTDSHEQLFSVTPLETLTVSSDVAPDDHTMLSHYEFLGRVLGKAVYESILVEPQFCLPFLNQLLGKVNSLEDLKNFDTEYYKNLTKLLTLPADQIDMAGLTFELTLGTGAAARTIELVPDGRNKVVTKQNVIQYVHLVAHQRLNVQGSVQTRAFLRGFRDLVPAAWVRLFSSYELQKLISGDDSIRGMDVASLQQAMQYGGGYHSSQPVVQWFWEIMYELTPDHQRKFLKFVTSCSRQPLLGFSSLEPAPCIQQVRLPEALFAGGDSAETIAKRTPLPTASTCMNLLKLPNYRSKQVMRQKLIAAIEAGAGFELS
jgi:ubiquitin-protein ligase E3 C